MSESQEKPPRIETGIADLDALLRGGFVIPPGTGKSPANLLVLIRGDSGSGKTTLALQIINGAQRLPNPNGGTPLELRYFSLEQPPHRLRARLTDMTRATGAGPKRRIKFREPKTPAEVSTGEMRPWGTGHSLIDITEFVDETPSDAECVIVLDGLSILTRDERQELRFKELTDKLRKLHGISIIVYEPAENEEEILDHLVDVVIELEKAHLTTPVAYTFHRLHLRKTRYQEAAVGWHQFKFRKSGIAVQPSVHFQVYTPNALETQLANSMGALKEPSQKEMSQTQSASGQYSILEAILGPVQAGHSVALFGPRGSYKTELSLDFLFASGSGRQGEHSLLVSLMSSDPDTDLRCPNMEPIRNRPLSHCPMCRRRQPVKASSCKACYSRTYRLWQAPGCISPAEFLQQLRRALQGKDNDRTQQITRLVFWDLTQLVHRFPLLHSDRLFLPALLEMLRGRPKGESAHPWQLNPVKSLFYGAGNAKYTRAFSAIADNVVFSRRSVVRMPTPSRKPPSGGGSNCQNVREMASTGGECVLLYVDRRAGNKPEGEKSLFAVPIKGNRMGTFVSSTGKVSRYEAVKDDYRALFPELDKWIAAIRKLQDVE